VVVNLRRTIDGLPISDMLQRMRDMEQLYIQFGGDEQVSTPPPPRAQKPPPVDRRSSPSCVQVLKWTAEDIENQSSQIEVDRRIQKCAPHRTRKAYGAGATCASTRPGLFRLVLGAFLVVE
jgi:hypothetical protein